MSSSESGTDFDSTAEMSLSPGNDHIDDWVGLSNPQYVAEMCKKLDAVNRLRATGAQLDLDIPAIAVLGSQSAGKSSLIEAISGITLPRASGTCTRCPTECQLSHSSEPWRCVVSLRLVTDTNGNVLPQPRKVDFGGPIFDKSLVTERIRCAQYAILNPGTPYHHFLEPSFDALKKSEMLFSSNSICLDICGSDVHDLSFVDLPGLTVGGEPRESRLVQQLAEDYIRKESCIILLTVACETDFVNQSAHHLASHYDPSGVRTIGVLTKPDRIPTGEEAIWISRIQSSGDGGIEYFFVKNPDSMDIRNGISYAEAREQERYFFENRAPWSNLERLYQSRLGTDKLTRRLGQVLSTLISRRLPELQGELDKLLEQTQQDISRLPNPPTSEPVSEILKLISGFVRSMEQLVRGVPDETGLIYKLRGPQHKFQRAIRQTAPDFRPLERREAGDTTRVPSPSFYSCEESELDQEPSDTSQPIFVDDVMKRVNSARTRELPNNYVPYIVVREFIGTYVEQWDNPSRQLFELTRKELMSHVTSLVELHFFQYTHGHLKQGIMNIMQTHIQKCADAAAQHIDSLLEDENEPFTMNYHYFTEYRSKFLNLYRGDRLRSKTRSKNPFIRNLEDSNHSDMINKTISSLAKLGLPEVEASSLASLLPPDPMEPAIEIMADVSAYFQVAYKRFVDNVPMSIDRVLVRGLIPDLEAVLFQGLSIDGPGVYERCRRLLREPGDIVERRSELEKRRQRLLSARQELVEVFL